MEETRKQFEKEYAKHYQSPCQFERHDKSGDYVDVRTRAGWRMWQASRAALVVELPVILGDGLVARTLMVAIKDCTERLTAAGITVKEK